jgi:polyisoprenoid-binding protein YceI
MESATKRSENNFEIKGSLTIKEIKHPITFTLLNNDNNWEANLVFDRSKYDVRFRSGSFFENLGDKLIYDDIVIETKLVFK